MATGEPTGAINAFTFGPFLAFVIAQTKLILANQDTVLQRLTELENKLAEDFTALQQALTDLQTEVAAIGTEMDKLFADLTMALGSGNQAAVDAATAAIQAQIQALKDAGARDAPPVPAPPPGP